MLYYAKFEAPILCLPNTKSQLIGKDPGAGKDWRQKETGQQSVRWLDGITDSMNMNSSKLQQASGGQGSLACCSPWDHRVRHNWATEQWQQCCTPETHVMLTHQFCLNEKNGTNNNKAPHIYALLFQTLAVPSLGSCFLSALCSGLSSSALKWGSPPSVLPHTPARVIFPKYNLPKSLLCLKIFQWVNKLMDWKASLCPPNPLFTAPHPVLHTPPTLAGWPVQAASVVFQGPLAPGWLWPVVSTAEKWIEGGEKCICLPSSHFMRLLWAVILFFFSQDFFFF